MKMEQRPKETMKRERAKEMMKMERPTPWERFNENETLLILSKVPRKFHASLRRTCKRFNAAMSSSNVTVYRKLQGTLENVIVVHIASHGWFSLCETTIGTYKLLPFRLSLVTPRSWTSSFVGIGSCVVSLGRSLEENLVVRKCSEASAETMHKTGEDFLHPALAILGGSLYAVGLCNQSRTYRGVKIDTESYKCDLVCVAPAFLFNRGAIKHQGLAINHKMYVVRNGMKSLVFDPDLATLEEVDEDTCPLDTHLTLQSCVIDNKIVSVSSVDRHIHVYDGNAWSVLKKVELQGTYTDLKLANHNGNLLLIYKRDRDVLGTEITMRREKDGLIGEIKWVQALHQVENSMFQVAEVVVAMM